MQSIRAPSLVVARSRIGASNTCDTRASVTGELQLTENNLQLSTPGVRQGALMKDEPFGALLNDTLHVHGLFHVYHCITSHNRRKYFTVHKNDSYLIHQVCNLLRRYHIPRDFYYNN